LATLAASVNHSIGILQSNSLRKVCLEACNNLSLGIISVDDVSFDLNLVAIKKFRNQHVAIDVKAANSVF